MGAGQVRKAKVCRAHRVRLTLCIGEGLGFQVWLPEAWTSNSKDHRSARIVELREITLPIASAIANAYIDFSKMTLSLVAVVTDQVRDGRTVIGYGFNSNGRYGQGGLIRERFAPRLREAEPTSLPNDAGDNLDPDRIWSTLMRNEKPGGHGERSVAVGTIDMAVLKAADREDRRQAAVSPPRGAAQPRS